MRARCAVTPAGLTRPSEWHYLWTTPAIRDHTSPGESAIWMFEPVNRPLGRYHSCAVRSDEVRMIYCDVKIVAAALPKGPSGVLASSSHMRLVRRRCTLPYRPRKSYVRVVTPQTHEGKRPPKMPLFGPPNIPQLEAKGDTQGLIKALAYKDAAIRIAAAEALAPLKDLLAVEPLVGLLKDDNVGVRRASVAALAARGGGRVVEPLVTALKDPDPDVRAVAAKAVYRRLMTDPDQDTRRATAAALGRIRATDAVEPLAKAVMDADEDVRLAAIRALQAIGDVQAVVPLIIVLAHEQVRQKATGRSSLAVERAASQALDALCDPMAIGQLQTALAHDDADVREAAVKRLAKIATPEVSDSLFAALEDRDPAIRRTAARGLAEMGWLPQGERWGPDT